MGEKEAITYLKAGVNIESARNLVQRIIPLAKETFRTGVISDIGGFSGFFALDPRKYKDPVLVATTDGVGTKLLLAESLEEYEGIGIDLVAMCVNDLIVCGAEPLFFLDYMAFDRLDEEKAYGILKGIVSGCKEAGMALIGGETAELPGIYRKSAYDLCGFAVGVADRERIVDGSAIPVGSRVVGVASSGPHSNGYSLIRKILSSKKIPLDTYLPEYRETLREVLLKPTHIYAKVVDFLLERFPIYGMVHITGGGFWENIPRVLPRSTSVLLDATRWEHPPIFRFLKKEGKVPVEEMYRVFNCGIGLVLIVPSDRVGEILEGLEKFQLKGWEIGEVLPRKEGEPSVRIENMEVPYR
jgi:phosphoribosylformylglycinamidine cyclo-ligase